MKQWIAEHNLVENKHRMENKFFIIFLNLFLEAALEKEAEIRIEFEFLLFNVLTFD